jgi:hypothetical protein
MPSPDCNRAPRRSIGGLARYPGTAQTDGDGVPPLTHGDDPQRLDLATPVG